MRLNSKSQISIMLFFFLITIALSYYSLFLVPTARFVASLYISISLIYLVASLISLHDNKQGNTKRRSISKRATKVMLNILFLILILLFIYYIYVLGNSISSSLIQTLLYLLENIGTYLVILLPLLFIATFAAYFLRKRSHKIALVLYASILVILIFYFLSGHVFTRYSVDDETVISFLSVKSLLNSANPYAHSFSNFLLGNVSNIGVTITTNNKIMGSLEYPALYPLISMPFYLISSMTLRNLSHIDMSLEATIFLFLLIITATILLHDEKNLSPRYSLILFFIISIAFVASLPVYIMLTLLLITYSKLDKKYAFILLGIALAIQEELWIPVIFFIIYMINNQGLKRGAFNMLGALAVFFLINSYFIIINPGIYWSSVFASVSSLIMPSGAAILGFSLLTSYPVTMLVFSKLFYLSIIALAVLLLYLNKKELIPIFSMVPFLFLSHALISYFSMFSFFFVFALYSKNVNKGPGIVKERIGRYATPAFAITMLFIILASTAIIIRSHNQYTDNFDISLTNQSLAIDGNYIYYNATISYNNLTNNTIHVSTIGVSNSTFSFYGFMNESIINKSNTCVSLECTININKIILNKSSDTYPLRIKYMVGPYTTGPFSAILYNNDYYYVSNPVYNKSIQ